jgi:hypothetical protein
MDKLKLTGQNQGRVFNSRLSRACIGYAIVHITKQPNLKLKTRPKQLLGSLPLAFALPAWTFCNGEEGVKVNPHAGLPWLQKSLGILGLPW